MLQVQVLWWTLIFFSFFVYFVGLEKEMYF